MSNCLFSRVGVAVLAMAAISGCGPTTPSAPPAAPPAAPALPSQPPPRPSLGAFTQPLMIGPDGAFKLTTPAPFRVEALAASFPGLELVAGEVLIDRQRVRVIQARSDGLVVFTIFPGAGGRTGRVVTRSAAVAGPRDEIIGSTRMRDLPTEELTVCTVDNSSGEERQVCAASADATFWRVFRPDSDFRLAGSQGQQRLEALAGGDILMEMRWTPRR